MNNNSNFGKLPASGYIRQSQLIPAIVPFSSATLWRKVKTKEFPAPVKLSARITAWDVNSIRSWLESKSEKGE
ncbi:MULTISPECIES: AlpA family transcriptional regulator [Nitrosospira]|uniref:Transcriptional regulator, AlpA family n=1 Tax=Nitrosospira multiformis TaxID=1231 RepID=A0ABY0T6J9_9PROT|nr:MULTISPECIES: AlpA family phage regulatory protein [Nitrosospira]SDQ33840.1 transcriptional regulator, AlpA family [Nitrosospira multiformis]